MFDKNDLPRSYSLYQVVARLFGHNDDEGLNSVDALPCLEFILEQIKRGTGPQAFYNSKPVSDTPKNKKTDNGSMNIPAGYSAFLELCHQDKTSESIAKFLKINRDDWRDYIEKLQVEIESYKSTGGWAEVFVRSGVHPRGRVDEMKKYIRGLSEPERQEYLSRVKKKSKTIQKAEADYIETARTILVQYKNNPFWEDAIDRAKAPPASSSQNIRTQDPYQAEYRKVARKILKEAWEKGKRRPSIKVIADKVASIIGEDNKPMPSGRKRSEKTRQRWITEEAKALGLKSSRGRKPKVNRAIPQN